MLMNNKYKIIDVSETSKSLWEEFNKKSPYSSFLQSFAWGNLQKDQGKEVLRLAVEEPQLNGGFTSTLSISSIAQIIKHPLPLGRSYLYIPHGPIVKKDADENEIWELLIKEIRNNPIAQKTVFVFSEPKQNFDEVRILDQATKHIAAETTLVLDIERSPKEILSQMKGKTRYNIRLAARKGVKTEVSKNLEDVSIFLSLAKKTSKRGQFRLHPDNYYKDMLGALSADNMVELLLAKFKNKYIAANIVVYYGKTATYLHGANDHKYRNLMAPHLLQWTTIKRAKRKGLKFYDLWGMTKSKDPNHRWAGFTRFKEGFVSKAELIDYPGPYEIVFRPLEAAAYKARQKIFRIR